MKTLALFFLIFTHVSAHAEDASLMDPTDPLPPTQEYTDQIEEKAEWFRNPGEYLAFRTVRMGTPSDVNSKILTDGKRFDVSIGKRISVFEWGRNKFDDVWAIGFDGGMLASLARFSNAGKLTFATNTFDGYFGAYIGMLKDGWSGLLRYGHLSAHLVDNSPNILNALPYSQFWTEIIVAKTFPEPTKESDWELHLQGSVGFNSTSTPKAEQPRASLGFSYAHALSGPESLAILASADTLRAGVQNQKNSHAFFLGLGNISRPGTKSRPYRFGVAHHSGSDYRNQNMTQTQKFTSFELSADF